MGPASSSAGLSRSRESSRTSRSGTRAIGRTAFSRAQTFAGTASDRSTFASTASCCGPVVQCTTGVRCSTAPQKRDCDVCPIRAKCCTTAEARKIPRDLHEDARDIAHQKMKTKAFARSQDERKRVEMRFAHLKTHHGFERMRLRGLSGARDEFHLAAIVQNLKTLALRTLRPPPTRYRASFA